MHPNYEHPFYKRHLLPAQEPPLFNAEPSTDKLYQTIPDVPAKRIIAISTAKLSFPGRAESIAELCGQSDDALLAKTADNPLPPSTLYVSTESGEISESDAELPGASESEAPPSAQSEDEALPESLAPQGLSKDETMPKTSASQELLEDEALPKISELQKLSKTPPKASRKLDKISDKKSSSAMSEESLDSNEERSDDSEESGEESSEQEPGVAEEDEKWLVTKRHLAAKPKVIAVSSSGRKIKRVERMEEVMQSDFVKAKQIYEETKKRPAPKPKEPAPKRQQIARPQLTPHSKLELSKLVSNTDKVEERNPEIYQLFCAAWQETIAAKIELHYHKKKNSSIVQRTAFAKAILELCKDTVYASQPSDPALQRLQRLQRVMWAYDGLQLSTTADRSRWIFSLSNPLISQQFCTDSELELECENAAYQALIVLRHAARPCELIAFKVRELWGVATTMTKSEEQVTRNMKNAVQVMKGVYVDWLNMIVCSRYKII
jgi:hypothetical protein